MSYEADRTKLHTEIVEQLFVLHDCSRKTFPTLFYVRVFTHKHSNYSKADVNSVLCGSKYRQVETVCVCVFNLFVCLLFFFCFTQYGGGEDAVNASVLCEVKNNKAIIILPAEDQTQVFHPRCTERKEKTKKAISY